MLSVVWSYRYETAYTGADSVTVTRMEGFTLSLVSLLKFRRLMFKIVFEHSADIIKLLFIFTNLESWHCFEFDGEHLCKCLLDG